MTGWKNVSDEAWKIESRVNSLTYWQCQGAKWKLIQNDWGWTVVSLGGSGMLGKSWERPGKKGASQAEGNQIWKGIHRLPKGGDTDPNSVADGASHAQSTKVSVKYNLYL